jgi:hypothetical protein
MITGSTTAKFAAKPTLVGGNMSADPTSDLPQSPLQGPKLRSAIEKKMEKLWFESQELGWSYNDFVGHALEVIVVLNCRTFFPKSQPLTKQSATLQREVG